MDSVPLPEFGCGCPGDKHGSHLTSCAAAHEYADNLKMEIGQSYRVPNWRYPLELRMRARVEVNVDLERWLSDPHRLREYMRWTHNEDFGEEKPIAYISWLTSEGLDLNMPSARGKIESEIEIDDWNDYDTRSWTAADTLALHQKLGIADADGNPCEPVIVEETIVDVERQLPFRPPPAAPQPTAEAQLLADLRALVVDQAGLEMLLNTWTHNAAVLAAQSINAKGVVAQVSYIIKNYGGLAEARRHMPVGGT